MGDMTFALGIISCMTKRYSEGYHWGGGGLVQGRVRIMIRVWVGLGLALTLASVAGTIVAGANVVEPTYVKF